MKNFFELYDLLLAGIREDCALREALADQCWTAVQTQSSFGLAMTTPSDTAPRMCPGDYAGMSLKELAPSCKSWNLTEAGYGMAAVNAYYNTPARLEALGAYEPYDNYCTRGLDLRGRRIGVVGHLNIPDALREQAADIRILERNPRPGDYPDSACDAILPECDAVIMTASTLVNKTLPHLMELCKNSYTILVGPTAPMCPALLELGFDRVAGLVVTDAAGMKSQIVQGISGNPYPMGLPFLLTKERL